ncbi:GNAT family N-acetyltransferase [Streptomyces albus]|uniref:GNAT family N-acetyltransferase n=1 Tax=Streptomyces albus TaxID=1888 RepID=A0A6C1BX71_9ACTN|nr:MULTISPECIES: GNAT family N-acetyltransferase [Streptomyces]KPC96132.1 acetyltransferase [Streptomyces sp. NRRL F-6602]EPD97255.1 hypothetical protein HMPREF1486_00041 [Streptomyces sp. HPH0547]QID34595.1 GNAT family N-acetyltransferase [Streptomyces albus]TGG87172.1 GNAT family N-acetyltransferase [Streptomyces albus]UVN58608.1 GNAT family N-acetyltransferase [Streptomyces albus]
MIDTQVLTTDDWPLWRALRLAALADAPYAFAARLADWQGEGDREERWRARLAIPGSRQLVARLDGEPAGMASGVPGPQDDAVEVISLWVRPEARGKGVADHLLHRLEEWAAQSAGARRLHLSVSPDNRAALALYERNGFRDTKEPGDPLPDGRTHLVLAKALGGTR